MTTTEATTDTTEATTDTTDTDVTDWKAEAEKWKGLADTTDKRAKRLEDTAKVNAAAAKELEALKRSSMTDQEKAVAEARAEARAEALREAGGRIAQAEIRAAAAGRPVDVEALLEGVDASKFLDVNGEPDTKAIAAWVDRVAPAIDPATTPPTRRDLGMGVRGQQDPALNSNELETAFRTALGMR
jgi:hypothetical protein